MQQQTNNWEKKIESWAIWVRENQERFWAITGTTALIVLFIVLLVRHKTKQSTEAWFQLGMVQSQLQQGNFAETRKSMEAWEARFQNSSAASYEKFLKADLAYRTSDYVQANQIYASLVQIGNPEPLRPLAHFGQIATEEMLGHLPEAKNLAQSFLDKYPDHYVASSVYMTQARLAEMQGDLAAASAIYERITLLFPQSPWTAFAKTRAQALAKK